MTLPKPRTLPQPGTTPAPSSHLQKISSVELRECFKALSERSLELRTMIQDIKPDLQMVTHTSADPYAAAALSMTRIWIRDRADLKTLVTPNGHDPDEPLPDLSVVSGCIAANPDLLTAIEALNLAKTEFKELLCPSVPGDKKSRSTKFSLNKDGEKTAPKRASSRTVLGESAQRDAELQELLRSNGLASIDLIQCYRKNIVIASDTSLLSFTWQRHHQEIDRIPWNESTDIEALIERFAPPSEGGRHLFREALASIPPNAGLYRIGRAPKKDQLRANTRSMREVETSDRETEIVRSFKMLIPTAMLASCNALPEIRYKSADELTSKALSRQRRYDAFLFEAEPVLNSEQLFWHPKPPAEAAKWKEFP